LGSVSYVRVFHVEEEGRNSALSRKFKRR